MLKQIGIAVGAGVTSAVLVLVAATASFAGLVLASLAPLPLMIVGLGAGPAVGGAAAIAASVAVGLALGPQQGLSVALSIGLPGWYLPKLVLLARPVQGDPGAGAATSLEWFPVARILLRLAGLASLTVLVAGVAAVIRYGGYAHAVDRVSHVLAEALGRESLPGDVSFARVVEMIPFAMTAWATVTLSVNLWLAARVTAVSDRLVRPWPVLPDAIRLPRPAAAALIAFSLAGYLIPGAVGVAARVPAAAFGVLFVFEGLAAAHVLTRGVVARRTILAGVYLTTVYLMPWPLLALVVLGCVDCLASLRGSGIRIIKRKRS